MKLGRKPTEAEVAMEVKAMRRKEHEERLLAKKLKSDSRADEWKEHIEAMCEAQDKRLKAVEETLKDLCATIARVAPPPSPSPLPPKHKGTKKSAARTKPTRGSSRIAAHENDGDMQTLGEPVDEGENPEEAPEEDADSEEAATENDADVHPEGEHDKSDEPNAISEDQASSPRAAEQQVVQTMETQAIAKKPAVQVRKRC